MILSSRTCPLHLAHWSLALNKALFKVTTNLTADFFLFFFSFLCFPLHSCPPALLSLLLTSCSANFMKENLYTFRQSVLDDVLLRSTFSQNTVSGHFQLLRGIELVFPLLCLHSPSFFSAEPSTHR